MKYEDILFEEKEMLKNCINVLIPKGFKEVGEELISQKYSSAMRPEVILTNESGSVDFKFKFLNQNTNEELLEQLSCGVKENIKKVQTSIDFYEEGSIIINNKKLVWFDFSNDAIGGKIYNIMFYIIIKNNILNGSYSCLYNEAVTWRKVFFDSIESIKEVCNKENE